MIKVRNGTEAQASEIALKLKWKSPHPRKTVSGTLSGAACEVSASSASGIDRVGFAVDGRGLNTELSAPYNCVVDTTQLSAGVHTLTAVAHDETGKSSSRSRSINVADNGSGTPSDPPNGTASTDPGSVVFDGDFDSGNASQWGSLQCNAGRFGFGSSSPTPLLGSGWMRFEVRQGDRESLTGSSRCEVADWRDGHYLRDGQEAWIRWQAYFTSLPIDANSPWRGQIVWQLHPRAGVSPTLTMMVNKQGRFQLDDNQRAFVYWNGPVAQTGRWYDFVLHVKNSTSNSIGFAEVTVDRAQQTMANGQTRIYHATAYDDINYPKLGIYRSPDHAGTTIMYGDGYQIGTTPPSVGL